MPVERPCRRKHTYWQTIAATPDEVFPLLCPVREEEWVPGWRTRLVLSNTGLVEEDCIFITPGEPADAVWITADHDPEAHRLRMYKIVPGMIVSRLDIALAEDGPGTKATISYEHTALSEAGKAIVAAHTEESYREFMENWEAAINVYLKTGERIDTRGG
jgi:hypothetical protein